MLLGPKVQFLALKREILGSLGQKRPAEGPNGVLPVIQSYPEIAGDMVTTFQFLVGVHKMEVYDCSVDIFQFFGPKMGLKPAQGRPVQCFQHKKSLFTSF